MPDLVMALSVATDTERNLEQRHTAHLEIVLSFIEAQSCNRPERLDIEVRGFPGPWLFEHDRCFLAESRLETEIAENAKSIDACHLFKYFAGPIASVTDAMKPGPPELKF